MKLRIYNLSLVTLLILSVWSCKDVERTDEVEIMPAEEKIIETAPDTLNNSLLQYVQEDKDLSMFAEGLGNTGYSARTDVPEGPHTIFAPVNTAYDRLSPAERIEMDEARMKGNEELYEYYIVDGEITTDWLKKEWEKKKAPFPIKTWQGENLLVDRDGENFILRDPLNREARIIKEQKYGSNGVVVGIDNVLRPNKTKVNPVEQ